MNFNQNIKQNAVEKLVEMSYQITDRFNDHMTLQEDFIRENISANSQRSRIYSSRKNSNWQETSSKSPLNNIGGGIRKSSMFVDGLEEFIKMRKFSADGSVKSGKHFEFCNIRGI
jgi:hypothetical protein